MVIGLRGRSGLSDTSPRALATSEQNALFRISRESLEHDTIGTQLTKSRVQVCWRYIAHVQMVSKITFWCRHLD